MNPGPLQLDHYGAWGDSGKQVNEGTTAIIQIWTSVTWYWASGGNTTYGNYIGYRYAGWDNRSPHPWAGPLYVSQDASRCPDW